MSFTAKGATKQTLGTIKFEGDTSVAVDERLVNFTEVKVTESNFPNASNDQLKEIVGEIVKHGPHGEMSSRSIASSPGSTRARSFRRTSRT